MMVDAKHFRCNVLKRWKIQFGELFSIRLHKWEKGDPAHYQHRHPWNFITFVIKGGYDDVGNYRLPDCVRAPAVRYRPMDWQHSIINVIPGTWSIVITGRTLGVWRFWIGRDEVDVATWNERKC